MDQSTRSLLLALNRDFYDEHAASFAATRDHPWPGWGRVLERLPKGPCRLLDAGCGNGRFARFLCDAGRTEIDYLGIDTSDALLRAAHERLHPAAPGFRFVAADLHDDHTLPGGPFDVIVLFGVLHHVPGFTERERLVSRLASRLSATGFLVTTLWRFGSDPRVVGRTLDWRLHPLSIDPARLEPGDHLLRWGNGDGQGVGAARYCHFCDDPEIERLIARAGEQGVRLLDRFRSDGRSGALNEYLLWGRPGEA